MEKVVSIGLGSTATGDRVMAGKIFIILNGILTFSAIASIIIEMILVSRVFARTLSSGNIYLKIIFLFLISMMPLIVYGIMLSITQSSFLSTVSLIITSIAEFLVALLLLIRMK